jgi:hypothetical protein
MKKTGEMLKKMREEKGLSLNEVGLSLKISTKVLKAIEEGDENQLPAKTFLRGFVKSYATFLRMDANQVMEIFYEEVGSTSPKPYIRPGTENEVAAAQEAETASIPHPLNDAPPIRRVPTSEAPGKDHKVQSLNETKNTKAIVVTIVGVILVALIMFTKKMIDKYTKEAEVPNAEIAETMEGATPVPPQSDMAPPESATANDQIPPEANSTSAEATTAPAAPMSSITDKAKPETEVKSTEKPVEKPVEKPAVAEKPAEKPADKPAETAAVAPVAAKPEEKKEEKPAEEKPKSVELIVEALDAVEIEYSAPSGKPQKIKLSAEQVHTFKSKSGLKINFSNGGAVNLILNGREVGIPGDLGKPIKLSY